MAEKVISQGEMDALMKGGGGSGLSGIQSYDLTSQKRVIPARILTLEMICEQFARYFQSALGTLLSKELEFKLQPTETIECGALINKIPMLSSVNVIGMEPLKGNALILVESDTVYLLLDHFFGGSGRIHSKTTGEFTPVEQRFVQKVVALMLAQLQKAWQPVHPLHLTLVRSETNPKFATIVPPKEVMIVVPFKLKIGNDERKFSVCLPYPTVEPIWEKLCALYQGQQADTVDEWHEALRQHMGGCKAEVKADLGVASLRVSEITALKPGDVILLDKVQSDELELTVEGVVKFSGRPGTHRGNVSFQVSSVVK